MLITENPLVNPPTLSGMVQSWTAPYEGMLIPVTYNVWSGLAAIGRYVGGPHREAGIVPWPFHAASILFHAASSLLVLLILRKCSFPRWSAMAGAAVFALHSIQVESVCWATGMKDILSSFLALVSILTFLTSSLLFRQDRKVAAHAAYSVSLLACFFGTLAKPGIVGAPLIAAALDFAFVGRFQRVSWARSFGLFMVVLPSMYWTSQIQREACEDAVAYSARPLIALHAIGFYIGKVLYPAQFCTDYGLRPVVVLTSLKQMTLATIPAIALLPVLFFRRHRLVLLVSYGVFVLGMLPVLGLRPFLFQYYSTVADRYAYLSMLGVSICFAYVIGLLKQRFAVIAATAIVLALSVQTLMLSHVWRNSVSLMTHCIRVNPRPTTAYNNLGAALIPFANLAVGTRPLGTPTPPAWAIPKETAGSLLNLADCMFMRQLSCRPELSTPLKNMIWLRGCSGRYAEAAQLGEFAYRSWPNRADIVSPFKMAWLYTELKNMDRAKYWMGLHLSMCGVPDAATRLLMTRLVGVTATTPTALP